MLVFLPLNLLKPSVCRGGMISHCLVLGPCICMRKPQYLPCKSKRCLIKTSSLYEGQNAHVTNSMSLSTLGQSLSNVFRTFQHPETSFKVAFRLKMHRTLATKVKSSLAKQTHCCCSHYCHLFVIVLLPLFLLWHSLWPVGTFDLPFSYLPSTVGCSDPVINVYVSSTSSPCSLSFWKECVLIF